MKKILNISVIAALAILPMAANAAPVSGDPTTLGDNPPGGQSAQNVTASTAPKYQLAEANSAVDGVVATAGYVKGAYNAAIKAVNKLADTKQDALSSEQLSAISNVGNLDSRLTTAEGDIDALETAVAGKQDTLTTAQQNAVDSGITAAKVSSYDTLVTNSANYATKTGVEKTAVAAVNGATIDLSGIQPTTASLTGTVPVVDTWGATQVATNPVSVNLSQNSVVTGLTGNTASVANKISTAPVTYTEQ